MIIKLQDSDITTAQDSPDDEGVIHVPDAIWNHIIKEVERPEQTFVNSLYIDVKELDIGGSGLPLVIDTVNKMPDLLSVNTWEFIRIEQNTTLTIANQTLVLITEYNAYYVVEVFSTYGHSESVNIEFEQNYIKRYYVFSSSSNDSRIMFDIGNQPVFSIRDDNKGDNVKARDTYYKSYIDFLWIHN